MLGTVTVTSSGELQMDNLVAVVAGGVKEVGHMLKR